ncbi:MAG: fasciclin domain-containing protein [Candidatus Nanopelagicaceae bacterium]
MKKFKKIIVIPAIMLALFSTTAISSANANTLKLNPLSEVLDLGNVKFDKNSGDFDVFTSVFLDVWIANSKSPVSAITDGNVKLTAFVPTDRAFRKLVKDLTGKNLKSERAVANAVMSLGAKTVEKVLLYHVVLGDPILSPAALQANGAQLSMASGETVGVTVNGTTIKLTDKSASSKDALVLLNKVDINQGSTQVAHGINRVLLPTL